MPGRKLSGIIRNRGLAGGSKDGALRPATKAEDSKQGAVSKPKKVAVSKPKKVAVSDGKPSTSDNNENRDEEEAGKEENCGKTITMDCDKENVKDVSNKAEKLVRKGVARVVGAGRVRRVSLTLPNRPPTSLRASPASRARGKARSRVRPRKATATTTSEVPRPGPSKVAEAVEEGVRNGSPGTTGLFYPGCHMSSAGGVDLAVSRAAAIGAASFATFLTPQRTWAAPPLAPETAERFRQLCSEHGFPAHLILPHGSYLLNLASPEEEQRAKSVGKLVEELVRCEELGLTLFNIHPGSTCGRVSREQGVANIAAGINQALGQTRGSRVKVVLENMSCQGHTLGGDLGEIRQIIDQVEDQSRVGVCLDTCHAMAAGYDLSTQAGFDRLCKEFGEKVGWRWLVGAHINDSQGPAGCHRDRHAKIGRGTIGEAGIRRVLRCPHFQDIPLILETPPGEEGEEGYRREVELLGRLAAPGE